MCFLIPAASRGGGLQIAREQGRVNAEIAAPVQSAVPDIPSRPVFRGYEGIGFRKLFWSNRMTVQAVGHALWRATGTLHAKLLKIHNKLIRNQAFFS